MHSGGDAMCVSGRAGHKYLPRGEVLAQYLASFLHPPFVPVRSIQTEYSTWGLKQAGCSQTSGGPDALSVCLFVEACRRPSSMVLARPMCTTGHGRLLYRPAWPRGI